MSSVFREAQLEDPEVAAAILASGEGESGGGAPALSEFTPVVAMLANLVDMTQVVVANLEALRNAKPDKPRPLPRPRTAVDRLRAQVRQQRFDALEADFLAAQERWKENLGDVG